MSYIIKLKILVIEDEPAMQTVLRDFLSFEYDVVLAPSAKVALKELSRSSFDIALVDLNLPDVSGLDVIKLLREKYKKTAVLVLTGDMSHETVKAAKEFDVDDYILKPVEKIALLQRIKRILQKSLG